MVAQNRTKIIIPSVVAGVLPFAAAASLTAAIGGGDPPPVMTSFMPNEHIQNLHPQPEFTITGSDLILGLPSPTNRPTVTLTHESGSPSFTTLGNVNFTGTTVWLPPGNNELNLLQAPLGTYDLTVTRPDGVSTSLPGAFSLVTEDEAGGDDVYIKHIGQWGGPVNDIDVVGDLAYVANGRMLRILDISDPAAPVQVGAIDLGGVRAVRVRDGYAYVGAHGPFSFCVVDVSDPGNPELIWSAFRIAASNAYPTKPEAVFLRDDLAYVLANGWVWAYDISDPHNVIHQGVMWDLGTNVGDLVVDGNRVYVGTTGIGGNILQLRIYDVASDPLNPTLLGSLDAPFGGATESGKTHGVAIESNHLAWLGHRSGTGESTLMMVDVSDPAAPAIVDTRDFQLVANSDVAFSDGIISVTTGVFGDDPGFWSLSEGLVIFDASDPTNLVQISTYRPHGNFRNGLRVIDDRAFLFDDGEGLIIMDIANPAQPERMGHYHSPSELRRSVKSGDLLYVSDAWHGFTVLNVADPAAPQLVGTYQAEHVNNLGVDTFGIDYQDETIYLGAGHLGLEIVDVSDPANPVLIGARRIPLTHAACSWYWGVTVNGDIIRVGSAIRTFGCDAFGSPYDMHLRNFDVSDPGNIVEVGAALLLQDEVPTPPRALLENNNGIIFIGWGKHLRPTVDTTNDAAPVIINMYSHPNGTSSDAIDVALNGEVLFTAYNRSDDDIPAILAQDVTDPTNPVDIGSIENIDGGMTSAQAVAVQNDRLYGSTDTGRLRILDVADPLVNPALLASTLSPISISPVSLGGGQLSEFHVLVEEPHTYHLGAGIQGGLSILEGENLPEPTNPADLNGDGDVNIFDLLILLADWGPCGGDGCPADLNANGVVDVPDLLMLLGNWG